MTPRSARSPASNRLRRALPGWFFLIPALLLFIVFSWWPILKGFQLAFFEVSYTEDVASRFVGLKHFRSLLSDDLFFLSWWNVIYFTVLALIIGFLVPVVLAISINEMRHVQGLLRLTYYLPAILPVVVVSVLWKYIYAPKEGLLDSVIQLVGGMPVRWLNNPDTAMLSLVIMSTWKNAGATMIIYLAALQGVPEQLYEAAELDGAGLWQRLRHITFPQIRPIMLILLILQILGTMQLFTEPFVMTGGGPNNRTLTVMMYIYNAAFRYFDTGLAAAMGIVLFLALAGLTAVYFFILKRSERSLV
ncbi:MAG: sugar ABC transporter permease [bacterium]